MIPIEEIQALADKIALSFVPEKIILFGSYATGTAHEGSDVDMLVVLPFEGSMLAKSLEILRLTNPLFPVDLLAKTPQLIRTKMEAGDFFINDIVTNGKTLYERANA